MDYLQSHMAFFESAALRAALPLAAAGLTTLALGRVSAALRHCVWCLAILAAVAAPVLSAALPAWRVLPRMKSISPAAAAATYTEIIERPAHLAPSAAVPVAPIIHSWDWAAIALAAWIIGAALVALRLIVGLIAVSRASRGGEVVVDPAWTAVLAEAAEYLNIRRRVRLLESRSHSMPMTWGILRPTILLPAGAADWDMRRRRLVIMHELGHIARFDAATRILAWLVAAAYWFNPLAWLALRGLTEEAERACDDIVLRGGAMASDYAEELVTVAGDYAIGRGAGMAAIAMARPSRLETRVRAILEPAHNRRGVTGAPLSAVVALFLIGTPIVAVLGQPAPPAATEPAPQAASPTTQPAELRAYQTAIAQREEDLKKTQQLRNARANFDNEIKDERKSIADLESQAILARLQAQQDDALRQADVLQGIVLSKQLIDPIYLPHSDAPWLAKLSDGTTVELLGVSEHPSLNRPWWKPDGTPLAQAPYDHFAGLVSVGNDQMAYELAVRLSGPSAESATLSWGLMPSPAAYSVGGLTAGHFPAGGVHAVAMSYPAEQTQASLRLGIASGDWHTVAADYHPEVEEDMTIAVSAAEIVFSPATTNGGGCQIVCAYTGRSEDSRLIAIDNEGKEHQPINLQNGGTAHLHQMVAHYDGLALNDVSRFVFQMRSYHWVLFNRIVLHRGM